MNENEHLLLCLAEECDEVGQRVMKALRFGLHEVQPGQPLNNAERIVEELHDLITVATILHTRNVLRSPMPTPDKGSAKWAKIKKFMAISRKQGVLA